MSFDTSATVTCALAASALAIFRIRSHKRSPFINLLQKFIATNRVCMLDGGLATQLEKHTPLTDHLWSARLLIDDPELIYQVHLDYYLAGAG